MGAFSCRVIDTRIWLITNQHWLFRTSFTCRTVVFLTIHFPLKFKGILQAYHVPPYEHVNLAACYRLGGIIDCEKANPRLSPSSTLRGNSRFPCSSHHNLSTQVQMSSAYSLPRAYPGFGSQEDCPLALLIPHLHVSLLCPIRSLFRIVGSSSSIDGGIMSYHSSYWRLRVARGLGSNGTAKSLKTFPLILMALTHHALLHRALQMNNAQAY